MKQYKPEPRHRDYWIRLLRDLAYRLETTEFVEVQLPSLGLYVDVRIGKDDMCDVLVTRREPVVSAGVSTKRGYRGGE